MTYSKEQMQSFEQAATPLVNWIKENCHPHTQAVVTNSTARLDESVLSVRILELDQE